MTIKIKQILKVTVVVVVTVTTKNNYRHFQFYWFIHFNALVTVTTYDHPDQCNIFKKFLDNRKTFKSRIHPITKSPDRPDSVHYTERSNRDFFR